MEQVDNLPLICEERQLRNVFGHQDVLNYFLGLPKVDHSYVLCTTNLQILLVKPKRSQWNGWLNVQMRNKISSKE